MLKFKHTFKVKNIQLFIYYSLISQKNTSKNVLKERTTYSIVEFRILY